VINWSFRLEGPSSSSFSPFSLSSGLAPKPVTETKPNPPRIIHDGAGAWRSRRWRNTSTIHQLFDGSLEPQMWAPSSFMIPPFC